MRPRTPALLEDIRDAAQYITEKTAGKTLDTYREDRDLRQVVERNFEVAGEALRRLRDQDPATTARITDAREIIAFRNMLIHAHDVLDQGKVWQIIQRALPVLKAEVEALLHEAEDQRPPR